MLLRRMFPLRLEVGLNLTLKLPPVPISPILGPKLPGQDPNKRCDRDECDQEASGGNHFGSGNGGALNLYPTCALRQRPPIQIQYYDYYEN